jgi:hypothetical protein
VIDGSREAGQEDEAAGRLVEDDGLVRRHQDAMLQVPAHRAREHDLLHIATLGNEVLYLIAV